MNASDRPVVHLVDDDPSVLRALKRLLVVAGHTVETHDSAENFLERDHNGPGCAVLDLALPGTGGLDLQSRLAAERDGLPVIFLTGRGDIPTTVMAMRAGAVDFLTKPVEASALIAAVERALELDRLNRLARAEEAGIADRLARLTPREREVLDRILAGRLNKQIAADLGIAEKTIKVHRGRIMDKTKARTVAELVRLVTSHRSSAK